MPTVSCRTLATGARQFVVHEALVMMWWRVGVVGGVEVHAQHDVGVGGIGALGRRGEDHLAGARVQVPLGAGARAEPPGRLDHDVDGQLLPRQRLRLGCGGHRDPAAGDDDRVVVGADGVREAPVHAVALEQLGEGGDVDDVVDGDDVEVGVALDRGADDGAADPAEAVDGEASGHGWLRSVVSWGRGTIRFSPSANWTSCARVRQPVFSRMWLRWLSTVRTERHSAVAISALVCPSAISRRTSTSRALRP